MGGVILKLCQTSPCLSMVNTECRWKMWSVAPQFSLIRRFWCLLDLQNVIFLKVLEKVHLPFCVNFELKVL